MIKDLKTGFKLMKYGAQYKSTMVSILIIAIAAVVFEITSHGTNFLGAFYFLLLGIFPMQLIFSTDVSTMIQTTKMKRKIQITIPITVNAILMTVCFVAIAIIRAVEISKYPEDAPVMINSLIMLGITSMLFLAYMGAAFKHFIASMAIFMVLFMGSYIPLFVWASMAKKAIVSLPVALIICYIFIVIGLVLQYVFLRLFYKHQMSKYAFGAQIRKLMQ